MIQLTVSFEDREDEVRYCENLTVNKHPQEGLIVFNVDGNIVQKSTLEVCTYYIKFSPEMIVNFVNWYTTTDKTLRFGQAFMNSMLPGESDPELFYEPDPIKAHQMIWERYVFFEKENNNVS